MDIRTRRKNLVVEIERELAGLDEIKRREYRRQHESAGMSRREEQGARTVDENRQRELTFPSAIAVVSRIASTEPPPLLHAY